MEREGKERQEEGDGEWKRRIIKSTGVQFADIRDVWHVVDIADIIMGLYMRCSLEVELNRSNLQVQNRTARMLRLGKSVVLCIVKGRGGRGG